MNQKTFSDLHEHLLIEFDGLSNLDSSIWLFEDASTKAEWLVLGGDAVLSGWQRLLAKERLSPYALKISHHGKEDALNGWLLQEISPAWLLITTNYCDYEKHFTGGKLSLDQRNAVCLCSAMIKKPDGWKLNYQVSRKRTKKELVIWFKMQKVTD